MLKKGDPFCVLMLNFVTILLLVFVGVTKQIVIFASVTK